MESPVRILLCAVLVVNLLLLSSTVVSSHVLPSEATTTTVNTDRAPRFSRSNSTWPLRRPKNPDVALNELHPKDSVSEEHTEKNAKYKDRGRVRFHSQVKSSTESSFRRIRGSSSTTSATTPQNPTETAKIVIVTPTPEVKRPAQIIDSMRNYKKTKMPMGSSSTTPMTVSVKTESKSEETEEYTDEEEEEDKDNFEKYTSSKFSDNFYTVPSFSDDFSQDSVGAYNKFKSEYSKPYSSFSSNFPEASYGPNTDDEPYKSESFFDFNSDLTTPRHSYFDSKYEQISKSIMQNLDTIKSKTPPKNATNIYKIVKENTGLEKLSNGTPNNKSTVIIKNTKEVRLLDNEKAGTSNKELSDVHGTSIYYEMSVLSTETYNIDHSDDDCDNDTSPEPTPSTSSEEELASLKATQSTSLPETTKPSVPKAEFLSTVSSNYLSVSTIAPTFFNAVGSQPYSTQNTVSSTERSTRVFSSSFSRNRNYSKRLNLAGVKDSPNSVTSRTDQPALNLNFRVPTRKFHFTTPKSKPVWMAPRRNVTRTSYTKATTPSYSRPTTPSTIYSEHFSINNRTLSTPRPHHPSRTTLTTVSSEIDPVLQGEISGAKKVVQSQSISDNSIPGLWKRGSTRFSSSTATSTETESGISDLEIPPTLAAWALASLRSPPGSGPINATRITHKTVDENELQKVADVADKKDTTTSSTSVATSTINNDIIPKKIVDIDQNRLPWRPVHSTASSESVVETTSTENKSEGQLVEKDNNLSAQNTAIKETTTEKHKMEMVKIDPTSDKSEENNKWISVTTQVEEVTATETTQVQETIPPVDATKSTGFESITKLPGGFTTPADDSAGIAQNINVVTQTPTTTDYDITTIRFSYVPTLPNTEAEVETKSTTSAWHPVFPTRTKITTIQEGPITTYRPRYDTTTEQEEVTTEVFETTVPTEVSSQIIATESIPITTATAEETTVTITTEQPTTKLVTPKAIDETTTTPIETTTMIISVVTEINTERERPSSSSTEVSSSSTEVYSSTEITETPPSEIRETDSSSEENSGSNEVITQETSKVTQPATTPSTPDTTFKISTTTEASTEELTESTITTTQQGTKIVSTIRHDTTPSEEIVESTTHVVGTEDTITTTDVTTEASSIVLQDEAGSGAAVAIAVSTIGVIALILLLGLLLVVRRRGRRGVYAQRCTPVSLDAYSLDSVSVGHRKGNHRLRASKRSYGNPAYDDEVTSHPMQYAALANFALDVESMSAEFAEIPSVTVRPDEVPPGCEDKNRYSNVLPLPETRVPLKKIDNDPRTEYINANFITGPGNIRNYYIACQAPLAHTVSDFWRMVWEQNSRVIVMLTEYMENGVEKCYEYLPPSEISDNKRTFGDYQIILMKREQRDKYAISSIQLINLVTRTWREVTQLWYFWPAKGVPDDYDSVIDFLSEMRSYMKISQTAKEYDEEGVEVIYGDQSRSSFHNLSKLRSDENGSSNGVNVYSPARAEEQMRREGRNNNGTLGRMKAASEVEGVRPCTVVCSSGAGRSAALIAADICARALSAAAADVPRVVRELRAQRPHSLSNRHHYVFLYKLLSEYGNKLMGGGVDTI